MDKIKDSLKVLIFHSFYLRVSLKIDAFQCLEILVGLFLVQLFYTNILPIIICLLKKTRKDRYYFFLNV